MFRTLVFLGLLVSASSHLSLLAQDAPAASAAAKPTEHVLGTVTTVDQTARTITVKDDKSGTEAVIGLANTRTLLKVAPGAKDLKTAVRISAGDLETGDRVDVRGSKSDASPAVIDARSVVLMSARELAQKRQAEAAAWQNSTVGTVTALNAGASNFTVNVRTPAGPRPMQVQTSGTTEWTRYSPADPKAPVHSALADLQAGDQVRILGQKSGDDTGITAEKVYSAPVRTVAATITSITPDGKQLIGKNLQTKQPVTIGLPSTAVVRKLDPQMAMVLARRFSGGTGAPGQATDHQGGDHGSSPQGQPASGGAVGNTGGTAISGPGGSNPAGPGGMRRGGDLSHMLERIPEISVADLKPGDAIVIWGMAGQNPGSVDAQTVLAGVEPVLQSAPIRQGQSLGGDWGLDMGAPAQ